MKAEEVYNILTRLAEMEMQKLYKIIGKKINSVTFWNLH